MATQYYNNYDFSDVVGAHRKTNQMIDELNELNRQIENSKFLFDKDADADYLAAKDSYALKKALAQADARGVYNANTGGLDNSWSKSMMEKQDGEWNEKLSEYADKLEKTRQSEFNKELSALKSRRSEAISNLKAFEAAAQQYYKAATAARKEANKTTPSTNKITGTFKASSLAAATPATAPAATSAQPAPQKSVVFKAPNVTVTSVGGADASSIIQQVIQNALKKQMVK